MPNTASPASNEVAAGPAIGYLARRSAGGVGAGPAVASEIRFRRVPAAFHRRFILCAALLAAQGCQHTSASTSRTAKREPPAECVDAARRAKQIGVLLYEHDTIAALASDALQAWFGPDPRIRGRVTIEEVLGYSAVFFGTVP